MSVTQQSALYLSAKYQQGTVSEQAFENFTKSENGKKLPLAMAWKKEENTGASAKLTGKQQQLTCYYVKGQPEAVFGKTLQSGRYFLNNEADVCLLDRSSAWQLFGTEKAVGNELQIGTKNYQITGILSGDSPVCILPAAKGDTFDAVTVRRKNHSQSVLNIVSSIEVYTGGKAEQVTDGQLYAAMARIFFGLNLASFCFMICMRKKYNKIGKQILPAILFSLIVLAFCVRFSGFGRDYLPTYWSDFAFFAGMWKEKIDAVRKFAAFQEFWHEQLLWTRCVQTAAGSIMLTVIQIIIVLFYKLDAVLSEQEQYLKGIPSSDITGLAGR